MLGSVQSFASEVYQSLPEMPKFKQGGSEKTIDKLKEFALPTLMSFGPSLLLQGAGIGTWACIACLAGGGGPICIPICVVAIITIPVPLG